jgi:ectoine hydroxylase-related dioxygenase (phytanoyl-CoA dioxygenase family)
MSLQGDRVGDPYELPGDYDVTPEQVETYQRDGHIILRGVASDAEIAAYEPVISDLMKELSKHDKPLEERDNYGKAFIQKGNLWEKDETVKRFVHARRFAKIAAELMGVKGVRIYHDQGLYKEPGGRYTPWHQDQVYWPLETDKTITMWMPLVPVPAEVGSMTFVSGSQEQGRLSKLVISDESHEHFQKYLERKGLKQVTHGAMVAGDATFHSGWTLHSSPDNPTDKMRKVMTIIYYADGMRTAEPDSQAQRNDLEYCFPGLGPGDLAASSKNPLVYDGR